jgi:L-lactate dehydrogenase complex protein LldE
LTLTLFIPCFVDQLFPHAGMAMVRVLERLGHRVEVQESITCCGQPAFNAGYWDDARAVAARVVSELASVEAVVIGSGSCGAMLRVFNPQLFEDTQLQAEARALAERTFEFSEFLVDRLGVTDVGARFAARVTFHDGCHGLRELQIHGAPRRLLASVRDLTLVELEDARACCGFGGTFSVKMPAISTGMGESKLSAVLASGCDALVSNDLSCLMHLQGLADRAGKRLRTMHLAQVLEMT